MLALGKEYGEEGWQGLDDTELDELLWLELECEDDWLDELWLLDEWLLDTDELELECDDDTELLELL